MLERLETAHNHVLLAISELAILQQELDDTVAAEAVEFVEGLQVDLTKVTLAMHSVFSADDAKEVKLERRERVYYKQSNGIALISGCSLPIKNRRVSGYYFSQCDFHPNCKDVVFHNCMFSACCGVEYLRLDSSCKILT